MRRKRAAVPVLVAAGLAAGIWAGTAALTRWQHGPYPPADIPLPTPLSAGTEPFRITLLGTSLTAAPGWPEALAAPLSACLDRPVAVTRVARAGAHSGWGRGQAAAVLATAPDLVTVEFATNDADIRDGLWPGQSAANHRALIAALREGRPGLPIVLMTMNPAYGLRGLMRPGLPVYNRLYSSLSAEMGTGLLDLYPRWLTLSRAGRGPADQGLDRDGLHPDPQAAAAVIVPALVAYIGRAAGRDCPPPAP